MHTLMLVLLDQPCTVPLRMSQGLGGHFTPVLAAAGALLGPAASSTTTRSVCCPPKSTCHTTAISVAQPHWPAGSAEQATRKAQAKP